MSLPGGRFRAVDSIQAVCHSCGVQGEHWRCAYAATASSQRGSRWSSRGSTTNYNEQSKSESRAENKIFSSRSWSEMSDFLGGVDHESDEGLIDQNGRKQAKYDMNNITIQNL
jgi:hypothetical protein